MIRMILTMNTFEFNDEFCVPKQEMALETKIAWHTQTSSWEGLKNKPWREPKYNPVWWPYLDDIFMIWTGNEDELREFTEYYFKQFTSDNQIYFRPIIIFSCFP